jgi:hypothetical protein
MSKVGHEASHVCARCHCQRREGSFLPHLYFSEVSQSFSNRLVLELTIPAIPYHIVYGGNKVGEYRVGIVQTGEDGDDIGARIRVLLPKHDAEEDGQSLAIVSSARGKMRILEAYVQRILVCRRNTSFDLLDRLQKEDLWVRLGDRISSCGAGMRHPRT